VAVTTRARASSRAPRAVGRATAPGRRLLGSQARVAGLSAALVGIVLTLMVTATGLHFAYRRPVMRAGIETAEALVALLIAYLVIGRLRRTRTFDDLVTAVALAVLAGGALFGAIPALTLEGRADPVVSWIGVGAKLLGALLFAAAAFAPRRRLASVGRASGLAGFGVVAALAALAAVIWSARAQLPPVASPVEASTAAVRPDLHAHPGSLAIQLLAMLAYTAAAVGFARSAERRPDDDLLSWFGAGAVFATYAWLNYFLSPSLFYADWVYAADVLRFLFYLMLLVGGIREINGYRRRSALLAVVEERRRLARDLHDGLAQELAFISRAAKQLGDPDPELPGRLAAAAERALRESRQVIAALATPADEPLEAVIERVAHDAAARFGIDLDLDLASGVRLDPARAEALLRITGEAVANAACHSGSNPIRVVLRWQRGRPCLQVIDRGKGFAPDLEREPGMGFGLTSMSERAAAVGARLQVKSAVGAGTTVEVAF
jgi:signal transduction histidine kinase